MKRLTDRSRQAILELQKQYPNTRSALIPALHIAQAEVHYLPPEVQQEIAELFSISVNEVHSVVTFYDMFHEEPIGKHVIHVCKNASCMLRGADEILNGLCKRLKVHDCEVCTDGQFTVIASECLGACDRAPMLLLDERVVGPVKVEDLDQLLQDARQGQGHPSPMRTDDVAEVSRG